MRSNKRRRPGSRQAEKIVEEIILDPPKDRGELFERLRKMTHPEEGYEAARRRRDRFPQGSAVRLDLEEVMERGMTHAWWLIVRQLLDRLETEPDELFHLYEVLERLEEDRHESVRVWLERWRREAGLLARDLYGPALETGRLWFLSDVMELAVSLENRRMVLEERFPRGSVVTFGTRRLGRLQGRVLQVNRRSISVETPEGRWRVSPESLTPLESEGDASVNQLLSFSTGSLEASIT